MMDRWKHIFFKTARFSIPCIWLWSVAASVVVGVFGWSNPNSPIPILLAIALGVASSAVIVVRMGEHKPTDNGVDS